MTDFRIQLSGMIRTAVTNAITNRDEVYGKQLASQFERYSLILRGHFGGQPKWAALQETTIALRRRKEAK